MHRKLKAFAIGSVMILQPFIFCYAQDSAVTNHLATVNADNINVRSDSNVSSQIICTVPKGEQVQIVLEKYDWYKIKLPKAAPLFIKKTLVELITPAVPLVPPDANVAASQATEEKIGQALKDNINIRLAPDESAAILGKINKDELIKIAQDSGEWYKIEPTANSFG